MPYYNRDTKRDHNFDNHPFASALGGTCIRKIGWARSPRSGHEKTCEVFVAFPLKLERAADSFADMLPIMSPSQNFLEW